MMKPMRIVLLSAIVFTAYDLAANAGGISIDAFPPAVVKTIPECGDTEVDPTITHVKATFSRDMITNQM